MLILAKSYLAIVAITYLALALWCSFQPDVTSAKVGFELKGGTGRSEFMTVYGGLEFGIAAILAFAIYREDALSFGVWSCVLIHGSLVLFRTISFIVFSDIGSFTYRLAIGEWVIFLLGVALLIGMRLSEATQGSAT